MSDLLSEVCYLCSALSMPKIDGIDSANVEFVNKVRWRYEYDSLGKVKVPSHVYYGASTERARLCFQVSHQRLPPSFYHSLAVLKECCALANVALKKINRKMGHLIAKHCREIARGNYADQFVVDVFQTGSATSTHMNFNEVVANLCNQYLGFPLGSKSPIHPNDHVNRGQSSNDIIPSAIHMALAIEIKHHLLPSLKELRYGLRKKAVEFQNIIKVGRTHLQDAVPMTLGQEFSGFESQLAKGIARLESALPSLYQLAVGGTAIGTGINTHPRFGKTVCDLLAKKTKLPFKEAPNHFSAQSNLDTCVEMSGHLRRIAVSITKIAGDLRLLSSGPRCGLGELRLPLIQPGSSIMPGKSNPVILEMVLMVAAQVQGSDAIVGLAGSASCLELNTMMPLIAYHLLQSIEILSNACMLLNKKCLLGIQVNKDKIKWCLEHNSMLGTVLTDRLGYDRVNSFIEQAEKNNKSLSEILSESGALSKSSISKIFNLKQMLGADNKHTAFKCGE